jgi:hypothetical protein
MVHKFSVGSLEPSRKGRVEEGEKSAKVVGVKIACPEGRRRGLTAMRECERRWSGRTQYGCAVVRRGRWRVPPMDAVKVVVLGRRKVRAGTGPGVRR